MIADQAWAAFFFGGLSAVSLVIGAVVGVMWRPPQRAVAAIMAFGAGALLSALAFELILTAQAKAGFTAVAIGGLIGGVSFVILNEVLNGQGGFLRKRATTVRYLRDVKREEVEGVLARLSGVPILRALPPQELHAIVPHLEKVQLEQGARVFSEGDEGDALYIVDQGEVDLFVDRSTQALGAAPAGDFAAAEKVAQLGPGEAFGEMALLTGETRSATAVAASDVVLWRIPTADFTELVAASSELSAAVEDLLARNLQALTTIHSRSAEDANRWHAIARRYVEVHTLAPTMVDARKAAQEHASSAPMGIFLGLLLDGIPESLVIGMSMIGAPAVSATLIVGLFLSNLPEAMSSSVGMKLQGTSRVRIITMWTGLMVFTAVGAFLGNALFLGAPVVLIAAFEAAAAGAMLTMIAETALPEAYEQGGWLSGIATLLGFLAAFFVKTLSEGH